MHGRKKHIVKVYPVTYPKLPNIIQAISLLLFCYISLLGHLCHFLCSSKSKQAEAGVPDSSELRLLTVMNVKDGYHYGGSFDKFSSKKGIVGTIALLRRD